MSDRTRRLAAVWFADIVGYTDLSSRDEEAALAVVDELQRLGPDGRNDDIDVVMGAPGLDAVLLGLMMLFPTTLLVRQMGLATGLAPWVGAGVVALTFAPIQSSVKHRVDRWLEGIAEPGQVVVSAAVKERLAESGALTHLGARRLKNVAEPVECWAISN